MQPEIAVRDARAEDAEAFVRAYEVAWDAMAGPLVGKTLAELASLESRLESFRSGLDQSSDDARILVAERDAAIVGIATSVRDGESCELRSLYVVPGAWGTGVARRLSEAALDAMRDHGAAEAVLWVLEANGRARRFYEREGWTLTGETRVSPLGPREVRYRRAL
ncbi:MAG: GNAT family N-acetyltransferase [Actinobacteria bacterium]|nr:MAG: GNAT family N-acetyltransferase [Actinomycetota bacterium]